MFNYGIGGNEVKGDASEAFADIPMNRTLMIEKLTDDAPVKPQIIEGLKTVEEVFEHFKPSVEVDFQTADGAPVKENLNFNHLGDFGSKGITNQSGFLQDLATQEEQYNKFIKQLKSNKVLMNVLNDPEHKANYLNALNALLQELENNK